MTRPTTQRLARFATAGGVGLYAESLARYHPDPATAVESGFLAILVAVILGALALGTRATPAVVSGGLLIAVALALPSAEGTRGALVVLLLVATLTWVTWRTLGASAEVPWLDATAVAVGWQAVLRSERLLQLEWTPQSVVWLLALPTVAALALWWTARQEHTASSLALLAALALVGPGLGVLAVAALVVVAALSRSRTPSPAAATTASLAAVAAIWWTPACAPSLLVLAAALVWRSQPVARWLPAAMALAWALFGGASLGGVAWLVLSLPLALLAPAAARPLLAAAAALALAAAPGGEPGSLAPALALAAAALPRASVERRLQAAWSLFLLAATGLAVSYPWLRSLPSVRVSPEALAWVVLGALAAAAAGLLARASRRGLRLPSWTTPAAAAGLLVLALALPQPGLLNPEPVVLSADQPSWQGELPAGAVRSLTIDSFVIAGSGLAVGRPVAQIALVGADGRTHRIELRHGLDTADWAARRLGPPATAPPAWLTWLTAEGDLAQRYRARWRIEAGRELRQVEISRADGLPAPVEIALLSVAAR